MHRTGRYVRYAPRMLKEDDYSRLAERWWQWALSIPAARNPVCDQTGEFASEGQPADVWFLAGSFGGAVARQCVIPAHRPLFFPLFNIIQPASPLSGRKAPIVASATGNAELNGVPVRGVPVTNQRKFSVDAVADGPFGFSGRFGARAWGLWAHVDELEPGAYLLDIHGEEQPGGFWVKASYELTAT